VHTDRGTLEVDVTFTSGAAGRCTFGQGPALPRLLHLDIRTVTDQWEQQGDTLKRGGSTLTLLGPSSLFVRDQHVATARILDGAEPYVSEERILHVLDVAERIAQGRLGPLVPR
jgi:hypothetical protein